MSTTSVNTPSQSTGSSNLVQPVGEVAPVQTVSAPAGYDFSSVTHVSLMSVAKTWDADAENDGIIVYPALLDAKEEIVKWDHAVLPVDVEIWTTAYDKNFKTIPDTKIYSNTVTITSWEDGNFLLGPGIKIPFEQMPSSGDKNTGRTRVVVNLPDGRLLEAIYDFTPLKA